MAYSSPVVCPVCSCPIHNDPPPPDEVDCPTGQVKNNKGYCVDPCEMIASLGSNPQFINKMGVLKSNTSSNYEKAYLISTNIIGASIYTEYNGNPGEHFVSLPEIPMKGYIHNHFEGGESTFSNDDIISIYRYYEAGLIQDLSTFFIGVTTVQGISYTIRFGNITEFKAFSLKYLNNDSNFGEFVTVYKALYTDVYSPFNSEITARELALTKVLEDSGLILTKENKVTGEWVKIENGVTTIIEVKCN